MVSDGQLAMADGKMILLQGETTHDEEAHPAEGGEEPAAQGEEQHAAEGEEEHAALVPLFRAPSADLSTTFALALSTMALVQYYGFQALGAGYLRKFWNTSGQGAQKAINVFVGVLEFISEISRILTFSFRLFGNIFAGEVVLATMAFLVTFIIPLPFYFLEVAVGVIQAFVFTILTLIFFSMATVSHEHGDEHH
ncbi:MAG: F0F1 ATP synthase subunit A [Caldilineaceae bacterium]